MTNHHHQFFINGQWVDPVEHRVCPVINPATEQAVSHISLGSNADVDRAVAAARAAFDNVTVDSTPVQRQKWLQELIAVYQRRSDEVAQAISQEMGAPITLARQFQAGTAVPLAQVASDVLVDYPFEEKMGSSLIRKEPIGVCALITPWNWPVHQIFCKLLPALAAGCTVVLKPSEVAPLSAMVLADIVREAGLPPGVFNLVNGDGATVGSALASHADVDMVSLTGSVAAGSEVSRLAAATHKRVTLELGGKSANIILDDTDLESAVTAGMGALLMNSGQNCNAPTRLFVTRQHHARAVEVAVNAAASVRAGDPLDPTTTFGPVATRAQYDRIQAMICTGIEEGATLACGGPGPLEGHATGFYVRPTVFADVLNSMRIAREEIFGPVLCILPYDSEEQAIRMANDSPYGLSGYVSSASPERALAVARRLRTGMVHINYAPPDLRVPFGGYKQSGNGREWGRYGMEDYLEVKSILGVPQ